MKNSKEKILKRINVKINVTNLYICEYNDNFVDLFTKQVIEEIDTFHSCARNTYEIYKCICNDYLGIKQTYYLDHTVNKWKKNTFIATDIKNKSLLIANCDMTNAIMFDEIRSIMLQENIIKTYEKGKATKEEILEVLKYSKEYFMNNKSLINRLKLILK